MSFEGFTMTYETMEIWDAMKQVKYRQTMEQLSLVIRNAHGNMNEAISAALNMVCTAVHAEAGTFWFYSRYGDGLICPRAKFGGGDISGHYLMPGEGIAGQVIETGEPAMIADCRKDDRWTAKVDGTTGFSTDSMVCVPLCTDDEAFGCIQLINKTDGTLFDEKDLAFAATLAQEISNQFVSLNLLADGKTEQEVAVLFVDIRGFTEIAAGMPPAQVAELLNAYLSFITSCIKAYGGTADKYIGDCALAYWIGSEACPAPAEQACRAALAMREGAPEMQRRLQERFGCKVQFGVGIHFGPAFVGNIGTSVLTDHTVVGETVNAAAYLEEKAPAGKIYISRTVADALGKKAVKFPVAPKLKGKSGRIEVFSLESMM